MISVETFIDWLSNKNLPWSANRALMSIRLIMPKKQPGVCTVSIRETWRHIFANCVLNVMRTKATNACQDGQIYAGSKAVIDKFVHGVQAIWDDNSSLEN